MRATDTMDSPYYLGASGDRAFNLFNVALQARLALALDAGKRRLFSVDTTRLYDEYLASFSDPVERQFHNCHCCKGFIRRYGGLVTITETGEITSALWDPHLLEMARAPAQYVSVARDMKATVETSGVVRQFIWSATRIGLDESGGFSHFWANLPYGEGTALLTDGQAMAVRREDRKHLAIALGEMAPELIDKAIAMLGAGSLQRSEALLPMAKFLSHTQHLLGRSTGEKRNRILWYAVGQAARGWCTPRASAFGALLEDVASGRSVAAVARSHNAKVAPLKYQRPQAAPTTGNIQRAESIMEKMGLASALRRRPMALEEAELFWWPNNKPAPVRGGVFSHLQAKEAPPVVTLQLNAHPTPMTFSKFQRDVLPHALKMQLWAPPVGMYCALTTAVDPEAKPILKWDSLSRRNPGYWYVHVPNSHAWTWGIHGGALVNVLGLSFLPPAWYGSINFLDMTMGRVLIILEGAADKDNSSLGLFPRGLKSELHEVRATIEAHSKSRRLEDEPRQRASGYCITGQDNVTLEVTMAQGIARYTIDRLE